jgi:hypothetical protein
MKLSRRTPPQEAARLPPSHLHVANPTHSYGEFSWTFYNRRALTNKDAEGGVGVTEDDLEASGGFSPKGTGRGTGRGKKKKKKVRAQPGGARSLR